MSVFGDSPFRIVPIGLFFDNRVLLQHVFAGGMFLIILISTYFITQSTLKTISIFSLAFMALPIDVFLWDRTEFGIHFARGLGWFSWITNEILLIILSSIFIFSVLSERVRN